MRKLALVVLGMLITVTLALSSDQLSVPKMNPATIDAIAQALRLVLADAQEDGADLAGSEIVLRVEPDYVAILVAPRSGGRGGGISYKSSLNDPTHFEKAHTQ